MSTNTSEPNTGQIEPDADQEVLAFVDEHRDRVERLANSDLPVAKYYQRLLDYAATHEEGGADV